MRNKRGITLVSLVVTIIILIILAGVSISALLGENGIITIAKRAKENIELAQVQEQTELNELYEQIVIDGVSTGSTSYDAIAKLLEFKSKIATGITDLGVETNSSDTAEKMLENIKQLAGTNNTGSTEQLYNALQYSGLVTEDMSFEEICDVLAAEYPEICHLYYIGDECEDVTGGWIAGAYRSALTATGWQLKTPTVTRNGSNISMQASNSNTTYGALSMLITNNKIDFKPFQYLEFEILSASSSVGVELILMGAKENGFTQLWHSSTEAITVGTNIIDISEVNEEGYLAVLMTMGVSTSGNCSFTNITLKNE